MPTNTFNLGKDTSVVLISPTGATIDLSIVDSFDAKQQVHSVRIRPLNGPTQGADLPDGWNFTITVERANQALDVLISELEAGYWSGGVFGTGQCFQYINELDGSESIYSFNNVTLHLSDAGSWKADSSVKQSISGFASTRTTAS